MHGHTLRLAGICVLLSLIATLALIPLIIGNYKLLPNGMGTKRTLIIEVIESAILFFPAFGLWSLPLERITDYFIF